MEYLLLPDRRLSSICLGIPSRHTGISKVARARWAMDMTAGKAQSALGLAPLGIVIHPDHCLKGKARSVSIPDLSVSEHAEFLDEQSLRSGTCCRWCYLSDLLWSNSGLEPPKSRQGVMPPAKWWTSLSPRDRTRLEIRRSRQNPLVQTQLFIYPWVWKC